jgi:hypothetical protein
VSALPHLVQLVRLAPAWDQPDIRAACLALPATIAALPPQAVIYRGRNTLTRFTLAGREVVAKAFPAPRTFLKRIQRLGRASKAVRAFDHAAHMQRLGIGTPEPFAALESPDGAAWYLCAWADDCRPGAMNSVPLLAACMRPGRIISIPRRETFFFAYRITPVNSSSSTVIACVSETYQPGAVYAA